MIKTGQNMLKKIDLLSTSQLIKYKGDSEYATATGGFISITVIGICLALFANMGILTIQK